MNNKVSGKQISQSIFDQIYNHVDQVLSEKVKEYTKISQEYNGVLNKYLREQLVNQSHKIKNLEEKIEMLTAIIIPNASYNPEYGDHIERIFITSNDNPSYALDYVPKLKSVSVYMDGKILDPINYNIEDNKLTYLKDINHTVIELIVKYQYHKKFYKNIK